MGTSDALRLGGMILVIVGLTLTAAFAAGDPQGVVRPAWDRYTADLETKLRFIRSTWTGRGVALIQLVASVASVVLWILMDDPTFLIILPVALLMPRFSLERARQKRIAKIEEQLDNWLLTLANALKASPSLGEALASSAELAGGPIAEEIDVALKEMRLGTALDEALLNLSVRLRSRLVSSALAALLVARQTGGNLSQVLEETAGSLREMTRLEGVLRAKTSDSRAQAYVLLAIPFVVIGAIQLIDPAWLAPLTSTGLGLIVTSAAIVFWLAAVLFARTILAVDL